MPRARQTATQVAVQEATTVSAAASLAVCTLAVSLAGGMMALAAVLGTPRRAVFQIATTNTNTATTVSQPTSDGGGATAGGVARITDASLVAYWPIDEGFGTVVHDKTTPASDMYINGASGSCLGEAVTWDTTAGALNFIGEHDFTQVCVGTVPTSAADEIYTRVAASDEFTAEVWFAPANTTDVVDIFSYGNSYERTSGNSSNFFIRQNGRDIEFGVRNDAERSDSPSANAVLRAADVLSVGVPTHAVLRWRGTGAFPHVSLAVNSLVFNYSNNLALPSVSTLNNWSTNYVYLAQKRALDGVNFKGRIYLAAIYDRALTDVEVSQNWWASYIACNDNDGDGYGNPGSTACPIGNPTDCDDANASRHPGASETCNAIDDDCNGVIDDGVAGQPWFRDADGDGFGDQSMVVLACFPPAGYVALFGDCNDTNAAIRPGAAEACNGIDDDCDGMVDDGSNACGGSCVLTPGVGTTCDFTGDFDFCNDDAYVCSGTNAVLCRDVDTDVDNDNYSACRATCTALQRCDCNDFNPTVRPDGLEVCDLIDNNCNGTVDEGCTAAFRRGDANVDGQVNIADVSYISNWLSLGGPRPRCMDAADGNDDGRVDISDVKFIASWYSSGTKAPPAPGPYTKGLDPTTDLIYCQYYP